MAPAPRPARPAPSAPAASGPAADSGAGRVVLDAGEVQRALTRIAYEIVERTRGAADVVLLGIPTRGVPLARRIGDKIAAIEERPVPVGSVDVTMYRDDLRLRGVRPVHPTELPAAGVDGRTVVLVDDVLFRGRTIRAALDAVTDLGRPRCVQLAVLIDRGHRELPIRADYVGKNLPTSLREQVWVRVAELDGSDAVLLAPRADCDPAPEAAPHAAPEAGSPAGSGDGA